MVLKIVQENIKTIKNKFPKIKNPKKIYQEIEKVNNVQLKSSLNNFLKVYNENN